MSSVLKIRSHTCPLYGRDRLGATSSPRYVRRRARARSIHRRRRLARHLFLRVLGANSAAYVVHAERPRSLSCSAPALASASSPGHSVAVQPSICALQDRGRTAAAAAALESGPPVIALLNAKGERTPTSFSSRKVPARPGERERERDKARRERRAGRRKALGGEGTEKRALAGSVIRSLEPLKHFFLSLVVSARRCIRTESNCIDTSWFLSSFSFFTRRR